MGDVVPFRKRRLGEWAARRAAEIDAQVRHHIAEAFRYDRDVGALHIMLDDSENGQTVTFHPVETQERVYL